MFSRLITRSSALLLSAVVTLVVLSGIDLLARNEHAGADVASALLAASAPARAQRVHVIQRAQRVQVIQHAQEPQRPQRVQVPQRATHESVPPIEVMVPSKKTASGRELLSAQHEVTSRCI